MVYGAALGVVGFVFNLMFRAAEGYVLSWKNDSREEESNGV